jgi:hypothetical protein
VLSLKKGVGLHNGCRIFVSVKIAENPIIAQEDLGRMECEKRENSRRKYPRNSRIVYVVIKYLTTFTAVDMCPVF